MFAEEMIEFVVCVCTAGHKSARLSCWMTRSMVVMSCRFTTARLAAPHAVSIVYWWIVAQITNTNALRTSWQQQQQQQQHGDVMTSKEWILVCLFANCLSAAPDKYYGYDVLEKGGNQLLVLSQSIFTLLWPSQVALSSCCLSQA